MQFVGNIGGTSVPASVLAVPADLAAALDHAVSAGRADAAAWTVRAPGGSREDFDRAAVADTEPPPGLSAGELDAVRAAMQLRTPAGVARAQQHAADDGWSTWTAEIDSIRAASGADAARRAAALVQEAVSRTDSVVGQLKTRYDRRRPYEVDPTITVVVPRPDGNPGYPSGHASGAYAAALVLAALDPERAPDLLATAREVAYSRVYGGVHFPSDVVMGARIGAGVAADVLRRNAA